MKTKSQKTRKLLDKIGELDSHIISEAYEIDSAEKLQTLSRRESIRNKKPIFTRVALATACICVITGVLLTTALIFKRPPKQNIPNETEISVNTNKPEKPLSPARMLTADLNIDSLDKLNYYAARHLIDNKQNSSLKETTDKSLLSVNQSIPTNVFSTLDNITSLKITNDSFNSDFNGTITFDNLSGTVYFPTETFKITTAVYFLIEVTESDSYLAERIGTCIAEVVMTDLRIGINPTAMITFRNGDKFYSCVSEMDDLKSGINKFWTHLYVDGFTVIKDRSRGNIHFNVMYDAENGTVNSISWIPYNEIPSIAPIYPMRIIPDSTEICHVDYEFVWDDFEGFYGYYFDNIKSVKPINDTVMSITESTAITEVVKLIGKPHNYQIDSSGLYLLWETAEGEEAFLKIGKPQRLNMITDSFDMLMKYGVVISVNIRPLVNSSPVQSTAPDVFTSTPIFETMPVPITEAKIN